MRFRISSSIFPAGHLKHVQNQSRLGGTTINTRDLTSKLDVYQRNSYNRTNHNRLQPQSHTLLQQSTPSLHNPPAPSSHYLSHQTSLPHHHQSSPQLTQNYHNQQQLHHQHSYQTHQAQHHHQQQQQNQSYQHSSHYQNLHNYSESYPSTYYEKYPNDLLDEYWDETCDSRRFTERRKKTVRFDGQESAEDWSKWDTERQGSQDSATKDSGIDTSSTFTSSEDSNRGDGPKVRCFKNNQKQ